jgi:hypothetical protein
MIRRLALRNERSLYPYSALHLQTLHLQGSPHRGARSEASARSTDKENGDRDAAPAAPLFVSLARGGCAAPRFSQAGPMEILEICSVSPIGDRERGLLPDTSRGSFATFGHFLSLWRKLLTLFVTLGYLGFDFDAV